MSTRNWNQKLLTQCKCSDLSRSLFSPVACLYLLNWFEEHNYEIALFKVNKCDGDGNWLFPKCWPVTSCTLRRPFLMWPLLVTAEKWNHQIASVFTLLWRWGIPLVDEHITGRDGKRRLSLHDVDLDPFWKGKVFQYFSEKSRNFFEIKN